MHIITDASPIKTLAFLDPFQACHHSRLFRLAHIAQTLAFCCVGRDTPDMELPRGIDRF